MATGVRKRPDGKWDAWIKLNGRVSWSRGHETQAEAVRWRNERVRDRDHHIELLPMRLTVEALVRRHLELFTPDLKASTRAKYAELLEKYVATDPIARRPAREVRPSELQAFVNRVTATRSAAMAAKAYGLIRMAYRKAVELEELDKTPTMGIKLKRSEPELDVPTLAETAELIAAVRPDYRAAVALVSLTGLRRGEVAALRWSAVNLSRGELDVRATAGWVAAGLVDEDEREDGRKNVLHEGTPKSKAGRRTVVLLERAVALLREVRREQLERARELGAAYDNAGGYVFTRAGGEQLDPNELSRAVTDAAKRLGRRYRLHDVRHAFVVRAVEAGIPAPIIAGAVGHADASFTVRRYFHGNGEQQRAAAARLERYLEAGVSTGLAARHEAAEDDPAEVGVVTPLPSTDEGRDQRERRGAGRGGRTLTGLRPRDFE